MATTELSARSGRAPATSIAELTHVGISLFVERGFDQTTVEDIARKAGIGRRTFFRYFPSKNDLPWGDFDALTDRMRERLDRFDDDVPVVDALRTAVLEFNDFPDDEIPFHRRRMELLLHVPTLLAHSTLRYTSWRNAVAGFVGQRLGMPPDALRPQVVAWTVLAVSLAAYEQWLREPDSHLPDLIREAYDEVREVLARPLPDEPPLP